MFLRLLGATVIAGVTLAGLGSAQTAALIVEPVGEAMTVPGTCDASAAVSISPGGEEILVWEDEQDGTHLVRPSAPEQSVRLSDDASDSVRSVLRRLPGKGEADLEGATWLGNRIFLIGSHGRNTSGEARERRGQLVALQVVRRDGSIIVEQAPSTEVQRGLRQAFWSVPALQRALGDEAVQDAMLAPERGGVNIEGLAAGPDDASLLIGFRNPLTSDARAIVVPLLNPVEAVARQEPSSSPAAPVLGQPILLDLDNHGIRSLERLPRQQGYLVLAGPTGDGPDFHLYAWPGPGSSEVTQVQGFDGAIKRWPDLRPEAMVVIPQISGADLLLISDDGGRRVGDAECKKVPVDQQSFRILRLRLHGL